MFYHDYCTFTVVVELLMPISTKVTVELVVLGEAVVLFIMSRVSYTGLSYQQSMWVGLGC